MSLFIRVEVDPQIAAQADLVKRLVEICPVDIFAVGQDGKLAIVEKNVDECTLCDLCIQACPPGAIRVVKLYE